MKVLSRIMQMKIRGGFITFAVCRECGDIVYDESAGKGDRGDRVGEVQRMILHMGLHGHRVTFTDRMTGKVIG